MCVDKLKRLDWHDVMIRSVKTFFQAAIPVLITALHEADISGGKDAVRAVLLSTVVSSATAGIAAVWNMISGLKCLEKEERCTQQDEIQTEETEEPPQEE
ncbi:MAG: hypothetical protein MJ177_05695 [Clostridia bacterium]|nr:hypothetical protein [Clostridia bacterium]